MAAKTSNFSDDTLSVKVCDIDILIFDVSHGRLQSFIRPRQCSKTPTLLWPPLIWTSLCLDAYRTSVMATSNTDFIIVRFYSLELFQNALFVKKLWILLIRHNITMRFRRLVSIRSSLRVQYLSCPLLGLLLCQPQTLPCEFWLPRVSINCHSSNYTYSISLNCDWRMVSGKRSLHTVSYLILFAIDMLSSNFVSLLWIFVSGNYSCIQNPNPCGFDSVYSDSQQ